MHAAAAAARVEDVEGSLILADLHLHQWRLRLATIAANSWLYCPCLCRCSTAKFLPPEANLPGLGDRCLTLACLRSSQDPVASRCSRQMDNVHTPKRSLQMKPTTDCIACTQDSFPTLMSICEHWPCINLTCTKTLATENLASHTQPVHFQILRNAVSQMPYWLSTDIALRLWNTDPHRAHPLLNRYQWLMTGRSTGTRGLRWPLSRGFPRTHTQNQGTKYYLRPWRRPGQAMKPSCSPGRLRFR